MNHTLAVITLGSEVQAKALDPRLHGTQAGSERVKDTKAEKGTLKEASSINRSLFTLGKVNVLAQQCAAGPLPRLQGKLLFGRRLPPIPCLKEF